MVTELLVVFATGIVVGRAIDVDLICSNHRCICLRPGTSTVPTRSLVRLEPGEMAPTVHKTCSGIVITCVSVAFEKATPLGNSSLTSPRCGVGACITDHQRISDVITDNDQRWISSLHQRQIDRLGLERNRGLIIFARLLPVARRAVGIELSDAVTRKFTREPAD